MADADYLLSLVEQCEPLFRGSDSKILAGIVSVIKRGHLTSARRMLLSALINRQQELWATEVLDIDNCIKAAIESALGNLVFIKPKSTVMFSEQELPVQ